MAAQGRGPDRTLVHMSPKEVQGLQALAMAHGGSLTINPQTGLPEAGFLESILPAVAGFALNAFAPGVGTAVGGMFGLGEAAGTALTVGGIAGLASGSLEKGIMAGMGAYGGASLGGSLGDMGSAVNARAANEAAQVAGLGDAERVAAIQAAAKPDISAGFSAAASNPKDFLQDNKFAIGAAFLPALMGGMDDKGEGTGAPKTPKYIRRYETDPVTGEIRQAQAISTDDFGDQPAVSFGGVKRMADGGPVTFGGVPASTKVIDPYDTRTDSQKSLDYLMGKGANPMLFTHKASTGPIKPADFDSRTGGHYILDAATNTYVWVPDAGAAGAAGTAGTAGTAGLASLQERLGGGKGDGESSNPGWDAMTGLEKANYFEANPTMAKIDSVLTGALNNSILGKMLSLNPYSKNLMDERQAQLLGPIGYLSFMGSDIANPRSFDPALHPESDAGLDVDTSNAVQNAANAMSQNAQNAVNTNSSVTDPSQRGQAMVEAREGTPVGAPAGDGPNGPEGRGDPGGDRGGWGRGGGYAHGGIASLAGGGLGSLGGYSDGGQLLRGPGDGVSDSIPAKIAGNQPARLADGEFVIPARIVSELGNGSTDAGARELYKMMARIQAGRKKTVGKNKTAVNSKSARHLPA